MGILILYVFGVIALGLICSVLYEKRQSRKLIDRLRSEVLNHQRKNAMTEYHEPGSWRR